VPELDAGVDTVICLGASVTRFGALGFSKYQWFRMSDNQIVSASGALSETILKSDSFKILAYTVEGCLRVDSFSATVKSARSFDLGKDTALCLGDSVEFRAPPDYKKYAWNTGHVNSSIQANSAGIYIVTATDTNDCLTSDTIRISQIRNLPVPQLGPDKSLCVGSSVLLNPGTFVRYQWQDGDTRATKTANSVGWITVRVWDQWGCIGIDSMRIIELLAIPSNFLKANDSICRYESLKIESKRPFTDYTWSNGSKSSVITVSQPGLFSLKVMDANGCIGADTIRIIEKSCMEGVYVPNAFTPNNDGKNDNFKPLAFGKVVYYDFKIFNRYGEVVFNSIKQGEAWDGNWKGLPQPAGNFVWQCIYQLEGEERKSLKGTVILIR
jgi:gliding motility-associated-like protein